MAQTKLDDLRAQVQEKIQNEAEMKRLEAELRIEMAKAEAAKKKEELEAKAKADAAAKAKFKSDAIKRINAASEKYWENEITGTIVPFTDKSGNIAPAMVTGDIKQVGVGESVKSTVRVLVFSPFTASPYAADYEI